MTQHIDIKSVARKACVSVSTASRVFNNKPDVSEETRERVLGAAEALNFVPSEVAVTLRRRSAGKTDDCLVVISDPDLASGEPEFYARIIDGIAAETMQRACGIRILPPTVPVPSSTVGVIMLSLHESGSESHACPVITVDFALDGCDAVLADYSGGAFDAASRFVDAGHRRIALLRGRPGPGGTFSRDMFHGFCAAMASRSLQVPPEMVVNLTDDPETCFKGSVEMLRRPDRPTAILTNDIGAAAVLRAANELSIRVPSELSVIGCDDLRMAAQLNPPLSTIRVPAQEMGRMAVRRLMERVHHQDLPVSRSILPVTFIDRQSLAPIAVS